jgi:hypothetical protein
MKKKLEDKASQNEALVIQFAKTVSDFRKMVVSNFRSRMGDEDDTKTLEAKIMEEFNAAPEHLRTVLQFTLLKVVAAPYSFHGDSDSGTRLSAWLQKLAFELLKQTEPLCRARPSA